MLEIDGVKPEVMKMFKRRYPELALRLPFVNRDHLELTFSENQTDKNLLIKKNDESYFLYPKANPLREAQNWTQKSLKNGLKGIYFYGLGLGYHYLFLKEWLEADSNRYFVFVEDDIAVFYYFLQMPWAELALRDKQVGFIYKDVNNFKKNLQTIVWSYLAGEAEVYSLQYYQQKKAQTFFELREEIVKGSISTESLIREILDNKGFAFFINCLQNLRGITSSYFGKGLFSKFRKQPAILVGAGPSLNKNIAILKELSNQALIIAGGSALNVLSNSNITPHLGAGIDPTTVEYERFMKNNAFETPIFYGSRLCYLAAELIHGKRLFFVGNKGGYAFQKWFEDYYQIQEELDWSGVSVMTFLIQIVLELACDPIIFVGMDLASSNKMRYAEGVLKDSHITQGDLNHSKNSWVGALEAQDIYGAPATTQWKWVIEANWISEFAKKYSNIRFINATEGGLPIEGLENKTLKEVSRLYLKRQKDVRNLLHVRLEEIRKVDLPKSRIATFLSALKESLYRCKDYLKKIELGHRVGFFNEVGDKYLKPFQANQEHVLEEIESFTADDTDILQKLENLKDVQHTLQKALELSNKYIGEMQHMQKTIDEHDKTPESLWAQLRQELAYRYYLTDLDRVLYVKVTHLKKHFSSLEGCNSLEKLNHQNEMFELELWRIRYFCDGIRGLIEVITKVQESDNLLWSEMILSEKEAFLC
tara:strand:- start:888 stop:3002 length:2115 start_codon:yes stop_codon:yes gene_type:complete